MRKRKTRRGYLFVEFLAQRSKIQEKIDLGWPIAHVWDYLRFRREFSGSKTQFSRLIKKYISTPVYLEYSPENTNIKLNENDPKASNDGNEDGTLFEKKEKSAWGDNRVEFIEHLPEILEKVEKGWTRVNIWKLLRSEEKYSGSVKNLSNQIAKYMRDKTSFTSQNVDTEWE